MAEVEVETIDHLVQTDLHLGPDGLPMHVANV